MKERIIGFVTLALFVLLLAGCNLDVDPTVTIKNSSSAILYYNLWVDGSGWFYTSANEELAVGTSTTITLSSDSWYYLIGNSENFTLTYGTGNDLKKLENIHDADDFSYSWNGVKWIEE